MAPVGEESTPLRKRKTRQQSIEGSTPTADGGSSTKSKRNKDEPTAPSLHEPTDQHPLLRDDSKGMDPANLLTGYYDARGFRVRHVAHLGALVLPVESLQIITKGKAGSIHGKPSNLLESTSKGKKKDKVLTLPEIGTVVRPSLDTAKYEHITVTKVSQKRVALGSGFPIESGGAAPVLERKTTWRTVVENMKVATEGSGTNTNDPQRIRGGGGTDAPENNQQPQPTAPPQNQAQAQIHHQMAQAQARAQQLMAQAQAQNPQQQKVTQPQQSTPVGNPTNMPAQMRTQQGQPQQQSTAGIQNNSQAQVRAQQPQPQSRAPIPPQGQTFSVGNPASIQQKSAPTMIRQSNAPGSQQQQSNLAVQQANSSVTHAHLSQQQQIEKHQLALQKLTQQHVQMRQRQQGHAGSIPQNPTEQQSFAQQKQLQSQQQQQQQQALVQQKQQQQALVQQKQQQRVLVQQKQQQQALAQQKQQQQALAQQKQLQAQQNQLQAQQQQQALAQQKQLQAHQHQNQLQQKSTPDLGTTASTQSSSMTGKQAASIQAQAKTGGPAQSNEAASAAGTLSSAESTARSSAAGTATTKAEQPGSVSMQPPTVPSSASAKHPASVSIKKGPPVVVGLPKQPDGQWEQHMPGPNDEMAVDRAARAPRPEWYSADGVSHLEQTLLPEWFDGSASHRTPDTYKNARETMIKISDRLGTRYLTATMARRSISGDAGSLIRLHEFLGSYGLINVDSINDSAPTPAALKGKRKQTVEWPQSRCHVLMKAVVEQSQKRAKVDADGSVSIDWSEVASEVGDGATSSECEKQFLSMELPNEEEARKGSITPETTPDPAKKDGTRSTPSMDWLNSCEAGVINAVTTAALSSTNNLNEAQQAALGGLNLNKDVQDAMTQEGVVARMLSEVVDLRMKKLENRLAMVEDVEGLLEAERVALELERRDLYTARCRHWFGGA